MRSEAPKAEGRDSQDRGGRTPVVGGDGSCKREDDRVAEEEGEVDEGVEEPDRVRRDAPGE